MDLSGSMTGSNGVLLWRR